MTTLSDLSALGSWQVIAQSVEHSGKSVSAIAAEMRCPSVRLRVTSAAIESWMQEPSNPESANDFLERSRKLVCLTGSCLPVQWACVALGGFFAFSPTAFSEDASIIPDWYEVTKAMHQLRAAIVDAYRNDRVFDSTESSLIGLCWMDVLSWVEGFTCKIEASRSPTAIRLMFSRAPVLPFVESHEAIHRAYSRNTQFGAKGLVQHLGVSVSMLQKWGEAPGSTDNPASGAANPIDCLVAFCRATRCSYPIEWLSGNCGGYVVPFGRLIEDECDDLISGWQRVHLELAELDFVITRAVQDGQLRSLEIENIRAEWEDVKNWMNSFLSKCEASKAIKK